MSERGVRERRRWAAGAFLIMTVTAVACSQSGGGGTATSGAGGGACQMTYAQDPRDTTMTGELVKLDVGNGKHDLELPQEMAAWLLERNWVQEHGDWHNIRRWDQQCGGKLDGCAAIAEMEARGLWRAPIQEQQTGDGYAFLVMHRHMIMGFKSAFPKHADIIDGFATVPMSKDDPLNPVPWVDVSWSDTQKAGITLLQDIENNLSYFDSEDDLGLWIQYAIGSMSGMSSGFDGGMPPDFDGGMPPGFDGGVPGGSTGVQYDSKGRPLGGIHGGLHSQWTIAGSPYLLTDNNTNTRLYAFWRLHGWIDAMWERYRTAKGITAADPAYLAEMEDQCEEMIELGQAKPRSATDAGTTTETGTFATQVAPIFKSYCGGCHDSASPSEGLVLVGTSASAIRTGLVGVSATETTMLLVKAGAPDESWLVHKLEGDFSGVLCLKTCQTQMPPAGAAPSTAEIDTIRAWISAGAGAN